MQKKAKKDIKQKLKGPATGLSGHPLVADQSLEPMEGENQRPSVVFRSDLPRTASAGLGGIRQ